MKVVAIFGVGLIGGSFALALRKGGFDGRILGVSSAGTLEKAVKAGVIDSPASVEQAATEADLLYLSQPISIILKTIPTLHGLLRPEALVTDAGSTKTTIVDLAEGHLARGQFVGGHPLAGRERSGVEFASPDLFEGRSYVLTPRFESDLNTTTARGFTDWLFKIGARPILMDPKDHDRTVAYTSHLPQLASTALAELLQARGEGVRGVFGPALLEATRLALSPFELWRDIVATNQVEIEAALAGYIDVLERLRQDLANGGLSKHFGSAELFAESIRRHEGHICPK